MQAQGSRAQRLRTGLNLHLTDDAIDASQGAVGRLVAWVRRKFAGKQELARVEDAPDSPARIVLLGEVIEAELVADGTSRMDVAEIVAAVKTQQPQVYQSVIDSSYVVQATDSTVTVNWPTPPARNGSNA